MKFITLFFIALTITSQAYAQERETFFQGEIASGGFGGPELRISQIDGETNLLMGGKGAWLIDHQFYPLTFPTGNAHNKTAVRDSDLTASKKRVFHLKLH